MTDIVPSSTTDWQVVQTEGGPVTLVSLDALASRALQLQDWATNAEEAATKLRDQASERFAVCGAILVPRSQDWSVPPSIQARVDQARALVSQISENDLRIEELKQGKSLGGVLGRLGTWRQSRALKHDRIGEAAGLRELLIEIAKSAPATTVSDAEVEQRAAQELEAQAKTLEDKAQAVKASVELLTQEADRRAQAVDTMGFDAPYEAAVLRTSGPQSVDSPLVLKAGERAYLSVSATLARYVTRTHYVGGSSGFSFPIGHTGIRYRVGAFHGQPVQQQALTKLDAGTFVVSNQRIAFIGNMKSTSVPLGKVMHVEIYTDGISVFREGRENPDFYLTSEARHAVFLLNWFLGQRSSSQ